MKKILLTVVVFVFCTCINTYSAQGYVFSAEDNLKPVYSQSLQISNTPYGEYLKYYNINAAKIDAEFISLSKNEEEKFLKTLTKDEKENYKYVKKVQKLIAKNNWNKVFDMYPNYLPAYLQYYDLNYQNNNYNEAIRILEKIRKLDAKGQVISSKLINYSFGILYFATNQYNMALNYFMIYKDTGDNFVISNIANCYYALENYTTAIEYAKKLKHLEYADKELLYSANFAIKNYIEANKYAQELLNENYNFGNLMRIYQTIDKDEQKLIYAYKARDVAQNDNQIVRVNKAIADIEQSKLEKSALKVTGFIKIPVWNDFAVQLPANVSAVEITQKQDNFFKTANSYLVKFSGQQLTNAFNSLNQDYNNYVQDKKNQFYQEEQLKAQQALIIEQQRNNMLQQEMIREQQIRNYLERQNYYFMSRPYYYHMRPRYIW
uniref:Uncharacterized protein n=1 Tax=uncultured Candidatus Melainabacteria bacterium TaxID=2682970 RepID=A0A650F2H4_9BACT|nr:hypothetical protein Melaina855_2520 [uncultured Candidatus Melainabacteria bacterium]